MAMHMQDQDFAYATLGLLDDSGGKKKAPGSPSSSKSECVFNPCAADGNYWRTGDWLVDRLIPNNGSVDVVTIVGPLAHGKSHSLNTRIFRDVGATRKLSGGFQEHVMFEEQRGADSPGTIGVWAAYQNYDKFLVFDTQGFHEKPLYDVAERDPTAVSAVRNAVKLMAMSDVVIFHTATPRVDPVETFRFLQEASIVMEERLRPALGRTSKPALIVFHQVLQEHPLDSLKFRQLLGPSVCNAFGDVQYLPVVRTTEEDFGALSATVTQERSLPRSTRDSVKKAFNTLFSSDTELTSIIEDKKSIVPLALFSCPFKCLACGKGCGLMQHSLTIPHREHSGDASDRRCKKFVEALKNRAFFCRRCNTEATVAGYSPDDYAVVKFFRYYTQGATTINCEKCGVIYSSDEGVWPPDERCQAVETRLAHVWDIPGLATQPTAIAPTVFYSRALLDPLVDATDSLVSIFKPKAQAVHQHLLDRVRPDYWVPDESATQCKICSTSLPEPGDKHHCRQCGDIFCKSCSSYSQPVPERGWGDKPVRVCNRCFGSKLALPTVDDATAVAKENNVNGRWLFEQVGKVVSVAGTVTSALGGAVVSQTVPDYWQKDTDPGAHRCNCCNQVFDKVTTSSNSSSMQESAMNSSITSSITASTIVNASDKRRHHCRMCGKVVCGSCSPCRIAVPERGWGERQVRVCNNCYTSKTQPSMSPISDSTQQRNVPMVVVPPN